ncbi:MAG: cysteine synthase family protein [Bacillota bacterium]|nr:cysteine synthase family protein [Bacillota bacterium]
MNNYSGNTPMVDITYKFNGNVSHIYAKLEYYNPSGSIKDRIASYIIDKATERGELKAGQPIVETTSGNTGIAAAAYGALTKHPVHIFMPDWTSTERVQLMKMYGANVHLVSKEENGFLGALSQADQLVKELNAFKINQFENEDNIKAHYNSTALEILKQLPDVTDFVSGVGSGGTIMGIGSRLKENNKTKLIAIEPDCNQIIAGKKATRQHKIEGIGDDFIPAILNTGIIDQLIPINDDDAIAMASKLAKELGLGVGISSGANFLGAVLANNSNKKVVTVFADDNKKYLSTSLANPIASSDMLSNKIELLDVNY